MERGGRHLVPSLAEEQWVIDNYWEKVCVYISYTQWKATYPSKYEQQNLDLMGFKEGKVHKDGQGEGCGSTRSWQREWINQDALYEVLKELRKIMMNNNVPPQNSELLGIG